MAAKSITKLEWFDAPINGNSVLKGDTMLFTFNTSTVNTVSRDTFYVEAQSGSGGSDTISPSAHASVYSGNARGLSFL